MDSVLLAAVATGVAIFFGLLTLLPTTESDEAPGVLASLRVWWAGRIAGTARRIAQARLVLRPRTLIALSVGAPLVLGLLGVLLSPVTALLGVAAGLLLPRLYLRSLITGEARAADQDAPRVLRGMVNRAAAGGTYPDLLIAAAESARHRWVRADFEEILGRYYANESLAEAVLAVRTRQASRNLRLVYDALIVLALTQQPASAAGEVLASLGESARANRAIARQAAAESKGLRLQAAILAVVIPALFLYLTLVNPELIAPVMGTSLGQLVLLPAAALLEFGGILLSWRVTRLEA